jgi:HEAT repeat protein
MPKEKRIKRTVFLLLLVLLAVIIVHFDFRQEKAEKSSGKAPLPTHTHSPVQKTLDASLSYEERLDAIHALDEPLSSAELLNLRNLVRNPEEHSTLRNDALLVLETHKLEGLESDLVSMWKDESENPVWRDYCLQHLARVHSFSRRPEWIQHTLFEVAEREIGTASGTALIALQSIAENNPAVAEKLREVAREKSKDSVDNPEAAVTAMQVSLKAGDASSLPEARKLAANTSARARLRMSAIGLIGALGETKDIVLLKSLISDKDDRVRRAADANLKRLKERTQDG